ncbi:Protein csh3 [Savitreella phatthalungensis]
MTLSGPMQTVILACTAFMLGVLLQNWAVDHRTLWESVPNASAFEIAERHYTSLLDAPHAVRHTLHCVAAVWVGAHIVKLHKPNESNTLFDGASLILTVIAIALYAQNVVRGMRTIASGQYDLPDGLATGQVEADVFKIGEAQGAGRETTIQVVAASNVIIAIVLVGIMVLQVGQGYAEGAAIRELEHIKEQKAKVDGVAADVDEGDPYADKDDVEETGAAVGVDAAAAAAVAVQAKSADNNTSKSETGTPKKRRPRKA